MKFNSIVVALCLLIAGCAMPYEEYCESKGLSSEAFESGWTKGAAYKVLCVSKDGIRFNSEEGDK